MPSFLSEFGFRIAYSVCGILCCLLYAVQNHEHLSELFLSSLVPFLTAHASPSLDPNQAQGAKLLLTEIHEGFLYTYGLAFCASFLVCYPSFLYTLWCYMCPGLLESERGTFTLYLWVTLVFQCILSFLWCLYGAPCVWSFLLGFATHQTSHTVSVLLEPRLFPFLVFNVKVWSLVWVFGCLPVCLSLFLTSGFWNPSRMQLFRKVCLFSYVMFGAVFSPGDLLSQCFLSLCCFLLGETSLFCAFLMTCDKLLPDR